MSTQSVKKRRIGSRRRVPNQNEQAVDYEFHAADTPSVLQEENTERLVEVVHSNDSQSASQHLPSPGMGNRRKLGSSRRSKGRQYVEGYVTESWNDPHEENASGNEFLNTAAAPTVAPMRQEQLNQMSESELISVTHHSSLYPVTSSDFSSEVQNPNKTNIPESVQNLNEHLDEKDDDCKQTCCEIIPEEMNTSEALWSDNDNQISQSVHSSCVSSFTSFKERPCSQTEQQSSDQSHVMDDEKLVKSVLVHKHQADAKLMSGNVQDNRLVPELQLIAEDKVSCITSVESTKENAGEPAELESTKRAPFAQSEQATMNEKQNERVGVCEVTADQQPEDNVNEMHELETASAQMQEMHQTQSSGFVMHGANGTSDFGHLLEIGKNMDIQESEFSVNDLTADGELSVPKQLNEHLTDESNVDILSLQNEDHVCDSEGLQINNSELMEAEAKVVHSVEDSECSFQILQSETNVPLNSQLEDDSQSIEQQTDTDFKLAGDVSPTEGHPQCNKENSEDTCDENTLVFQNTTGNIIVAAEITSSSDKDQFLKSTEEIHSVEENVGIQTKEPENISQPEVYETFTTELMQSQEDSPSQNLSNHGEEVNSFTSVADELYQGASSPVALDQDMDMKQGDDVETAEDPTVENWTANYDKDPVNLVDSVSGEDEVGEKCHVPVRDGSAVTEIDVTQEDINVVLFSAAESDSSAPFHKENSKVLAEPTGDVCEENGISNAADGHKSQQDTQEQMHFIDDDMHTSTKQKRRKIGSTRRINLNRGQEEGMDTSDVTKEADFHAEAEETNESFSSVDMKKTVELKCNENNLHQVLDERDVGSVVTDMTHTLTRLIVKENDHYTDIKVAKHTNPDEAVAHEEVSESTTWESAINVMDNKEMIYTEQKTSGRPSPDSTPSQISQNDAEEAEQALNEDISGQSVKKRRIGSRRRVPNRNEQAVDYEFHAADTPSVLQEENTERLVEVVHSNDSQSASQHLPSPGMGNRRKLGSSRRSKGRQYVEGYVTESWNDPHEENASGNEFLNTAAAPTVAPMRQEQLNQMSESELISVTHHSSLYPVTSSDFSSEVQNPNKTNIPESVQNLNEHLDEKDDDCKQICCEIIPEEMNTSEALWSDNDNQISQSVHSSCVSSFTSFKERPCSQTEQQSSDQSHVMDDEKFVKSVLVHKHQADAKLMSGNVQDNCLVPELQLIAEDKVSCITSVESTKENAGEPAELESTERAPFAQSEQATMNEKQNERVGVCEVTADQQPEDNVNEMHELETASAQMQEMHQTQSSGFVMHGANGTSDFGHLLEIGKNVDAQESEFSVNDLTADGELSVPKQLNEHLTDESNVDILSLRNEDHVCDSEGLQINNSELMEAEAKVVHSVEDSECSFQILQSETNVPLNSQLEDDSQSIEQQTDTDFKLAGDVSPTEGHPQCNKENSEDTCDENTLVFQNTTGNIIVAAEITSSSDKDQFRKSTEEIHSVEENVGIQTKEPENISQPEVYETFTTELMQSQEDSPSQNLSNHGEEVNSFTSVADELYQGASSPVALDQDMDMKQGDDVETAEDPTVENWTANYDKDPVNLVDSVSGEDEVGEKCHVPVRDGSAVTEIDVTQEDINVVLFSAAESDSSAPFHKENSKVLAEPTGDVCEENGISNAADGHKSQRDTQEQMHFIDDDMHTSTKQKRRKIGSTRRINLNRGQEEGMDTSDVTKEADFHAEAEETNESFSGVDMKKTVELKCNENNLHQVLDERDVGSVVTDMTHTLTRLIVKENDHYTDIKVAKHTNPDEAVAHEEVSESTTWESAINVMDNKEMIYTEQKTSGRPSPDSTPSQISQNDAEEAEQALNEDISGQSVKKRRIGSRRRVPKENKQGDPDDEFHAVDAPSLLKGYEQEENTEMFVKVVHTNYSQSVSQHPPSQEASGNRRKLGSSRRSKGRKYVMDCVAESQSEPHEEPMENTSGHDILNTPAAPAVVATVGQEELQESLLTTLIERPCSQTEQHLSDQSHVMDTPDDVSMEETRRIPAKEPDNLSQLVEYETFTMGLMQPPDDSPFQNLSNHGEEVISIISIVDELYQEACSPDALDQNMDMKQGGDAETAEDATVKNTVANYDKDSRRLVDSVSGHGGGENCDVLAKEDSAAAEIDATQENINAVLFSAAESDSSAQFQEENSKVLTQPTGDVCEENGISSAADGYKSQQDALEETHFKYNDNLDTNTKHKRRKMGSSRRMKLHREQEGEIDNKDATKDSDFHAEAEKRNESFGAEMKKTVESKSIENDPQQVKERGIGSVVTDLTHTSTQLTHVKENDSYADNKMSERPNLYEAAAHEEVGESTTCNSAVINMMDNRETIDTEEKTSGRTSPDSSSCQISQKATSVAEETINKQMGTFEELSEKRNANASLSNIYESLSASVLHCADNTDTSGNSGLITLTAQPASHSEEEVGVNYTDTEKNLISVTGESKDDNEHEPKITSEGAHHTNTSQDSNAPSRRRKLGSTRRNFGSRTKVEDLHQKQEMVAETATSERDVLTEHILVDKELLQDQTQHGVCGAEQEKANAFQTVEHSLTCDNNLTSLAWQPVEEIPVSHIQLEETEHCQPPNDFPSRSPDSSAQDLQSESTSGGRKRKMGSHRKTRGHQFSENRSACEDKITGDRNGRQVESTRDAAAIHTSKDEREESLKKTEVNENGRRPSCNRSSESGVNFPSEKAPEHVTVQQTRAEVHLVPKTENRHSLGNTKGTNVTPQCYNIVMVGNSGVGKTSFMKRAQSGAFSSDVCASVGIDSCTVTVNVSGEAVVLRLWDTAGQERFHSLTRQMFHRAQAFLLMYDVTLADSFSAVRYWVTCIQEGAAENVTILLLGNKSDCAEHRVNSQEGEILAKEYKFDFMECSAATGHNVTHSLETLARTLSQKVDPKEEALPLHKKPQQRRALGCC